MTPTPLRQEREDKILLPASTLLETRRGGWKLVRRLRVVVLNPGYSTRGLECGAKTDTILEQSGRGEYRLGFKQGTIADERSSTYRGVASGTLHGTCPADGG